MPSYYGTRFGRVKRTGQKFLILVKSLAAWDGTRENGSRQVIRRTRNRPESLGQSSRELNIRLARPTASRGGCVAMPAADASVRERPSPGAGFGDVVACASLCENTQPDSGL